MQDSVQVEQCDRDRAKNWQFLWKCDLVSSVTDLAEEFARHRLSAIAEHTRLSSTPTREVEELRAAALEVSNSAQRSYRSRGKDRYIEDERGECMMLVPHEAWYRLAHSAALAERP